MIRLILAFLIITLPIIFLLPPPEEFWKGLAVILGIVWGLHLANYKDPNIVA